MLGLATAAATVTGSKTAVIDKLAYGDTLKDLATGYRLYTSAP
jgi:hypothetical protein